MNTLSWFESWFNSPYYHLLYSHRSEAEAKDFISRIVLQLGLPQGSKVLDIACGKGRHARTLHALGLEVDAFDLAENSIAEAKKSETDGLHFFEGDMRKPFREAYYDAAFNLFTSFGYLANDKENNEAFTASLANVKAGGCFILDYLNAARSLAQLIPSETIEKEGIVFHIRRHFDGKYFKKSIAFEAEGSKFQFEESVRGYMLEDFEKMAERAGGTITNMWGNYQLESFDTATSDRLILEIKHQD